MTAEDLRGRIAIISGGLGALGRAIALELARAGADVALGDVRSPDGAEPVLAELKDLGVRARYDRVDVSDATAVDTWVAAVEGTLGTPDVIIPNAAVVTECGIREISAEQWTRELSINLNGYFFVSQACVRRLLAKKQPGRIVFIGSWAAHKPHPDIPAYCVSKAGVRMLAQCLALNLAADGILVNELALGFVNGGLGSKILDDRGIEDRTRSWVPVHLLISPEEVAHQVVHLCEFDNRHITGSVLRMDGGLSLTNISHGTRSY